MGTPPHHHLLHHVFPSLIAKETRTHGKSETGLIDYHAPGPANSKIVATKPTETQRDLSLASLAGRRLSRARRSPTTRNSPLTTPPGANLVAVISNGTAILGLNARPLAAKPVMEGKAVLF